ncbi:hypothetical protein VZO05_14310 [Aggregatilineales bacterium SYSU G02658]
MDRKTALTMGVIVVLVFALYLASPPASSPTNVRPRTATPSPTSPEATPLPPLDEARLLPISGDNLDGQMLTFPSDFNAPFNLVVMPFNRDQQTAAVGWLATFEQAANRDARVAYYSIAALTDLTPLVKTLVVQGLNVAVREPATRQRVVVAFLEDQAATVAALGAGDTSAMRVLIVAQDGRVLWQTSGEHNAEREAALIEALDELIAADGE